MKKGYNIILGLALLITVAACYLFKKQRYYSVKTGEEVVNQRYASYKQDDEFNYLIREESSLNYEAGFTAGLITLGIGFLVIGFKNKF